MRENKRLLTRFVLLTLAALLAALPWTAATADDPETLKLLPGDWAFTGSLEEEEGDEGDTADLALLTLAADGSLSLQCCGRDGALLGTFRGSWSSALVQDGMDRLTLAFTATDHPAHAGEEYGVTCVYDIYTESWVEQDVYHLYLLMELAEKTGLPPFEEIYGEEAAWSLALHREQGPNMQVVNCKTFVSLRARPDTGSPRLAEVPLGALVLADLPAGATNGFFRCSWQDQEGYILATYLQPLE